jgi:hypothetical protein
MRDSVLDSISPECYCNRVVWAADNLKFGDSASEDAREVLSWVQMPVDDESDYCRISFNSAVTRHGPPVPR